MLNDCKVQEENSRGSKQRWFSVQATKQSPSLTGETSTYGTFSFEAESERERKEWVAALKKAAKQSLAANFEKMSAKNVWREYLKSSQIYLVTSATSIIGQEVVRLLLLRGLRVRVLVSGVAEAEVISSLFSHFLEICEGDIFNGTVTVLFFFLFSSIDTPRMCIITTEIVLQTACKNVSKILLLAPPNIQFVKFARKIIATALLEKVQRIVKLSDWCERFPTNVCACAMDCYNYPSSSFV